MGKLEAKQVLVTYQIRIRMFEEGINNLCEEIKQFMRALVEKLSLMSPDEEVTIRNHSFFDAKGKLIIKIPLVEDKQ